MISELEGPREMRVESLRWPAHSDTHLAQCYHSDLVTAGDHKSVCRPWCRNGNPSGLNGFNLTTNSNQLFSFSWVKNSYLTATVRGDQGSSKSEGEKGVCLFPQEERDIREGLLLRHSWQGPTFSGLPCLIHTSEASGWMRGDGRDWVCKHGALSVLGVYLSHNHIFRIKAGNSTQMHTAVVQPLGCDLKSVWTFCLSGREVCVQAWFSSN